MFTTDKQTLDDLGILGEGESIYGLYNRTCTRGGAELLVEMFRYPLSDAAKINDRGRLIRYFAEKSIAFPFKPEAIGVAEQYLGNTDERTRLVAREQTLGKKMADWVTTNDSYKELYKGVTLLAGLLQELQRFIEDNMLPCDVYARDREQIMALLTAPSLKPILGENIKVRLSYTRVADYDSVLRFRERGKVKKLLQYIYALDVYMAVARTVSELGFTFPVVLPGDEHLLEVKDLYHPRVKHAVANSISIGRDRHVIFLTGANMAGKSTFMKSLGIAVYIAHVGFPVAAGAMKFSVMDGIYTTINLPDNLGSGASHFYAEVLRVKKVARDLSAGKKLFVLFDELFRGTNVKDANEATIAITEAFGRHHDSMFVISTHIIEAGEVLRRGNDHVCFRYLPTLMHNHVPEYTYKLREGITDDRHGMIIICNEGIPDMLRDGTDIKNGNDDNQAFIADKQTLDDLNLLGKYKRGSVYSLFCHARTRGGERLLDDMFRHPLTSADAINERCSIFQYFQEARLSFPFDSDQVNLFGEYLDTGISNTLLGVMVNTATKRWLADLVRDERYQNFLDGLHAAATILEHCYRFLLAMEPPPANPLCNRKDAVMKILADRRLVKLRSAGSVKTMSLKKLVSYDHLLRHILKNEMTAVMSFINELDVYITVSDVARTRNFTYAKALEPGSGRLYAACLRHPCLEGAIGNDLFLHEDNHVMFLTGANMAGKSTLMKTAGIALYLAQMGFPVAADAMEFSVRDGLYCSINVPDDIRLGYSHFYAEVLRVKEAAKLVVHGKRLLVIFDELFKGTNVKDAFDGTLEITRSLAAYKKCLFIVSTHIIEVGEALQGRPGIQFAYMPTMMENGHPRYSYKLAKGITADRQGMVIIKHEGILKLLEE